MNRGDIKLVIDQLDGIELGYTNKDDDWIIQNSINMLETLGNKVAELEAWNDKIGCTNYRLRQQVAEQAAVIEKLRGVVKSCLSDLEGGFIRCGRCGDQEDTKTMDIVPWMQEALSIPTDSKQILADWMREQIGEPVFYQHESGAISTNDIDMNAGKRTALVRLPECLK